MRDARFVTRREFEEGSDVFEVAALALGATGLDLAELVEALR
jgi:hypothetical protein